MKFKSEFLEVKSGPVTNFIRFTAINALELNHEARTIKLSIQDQKENFIIQCGSDAVFAGYVRLFNTVLQINYQLPETETPEAAPPEADSGDDESVEAPAAGESMVAPPPESGEAEIPGDSARSPDNADENAVS